jgi:hypothetical protein
VGTCTYDNDYWPTIKNKLFESQLILWLFLSLHSIYSVELEDNWELWIGKDLEGCHYGIYIRNYLSVCLEDWGKSWNDLVQDKKPYWGGFALDSANLIPVHTAQ